MIVFHKLFELLKAIGRFLSRPLTVMIVPHSGASVRMFQLSYTLVPIAIILMLGGFFAAFTYITGKSMKKSELQFSNYRRRESVESLKHMKSGISNFVGRVSYANELNALMKKAGYLEDDQSIFAVGGQDESNVALSAGFTDDGDSPEDLLKLRIIINELGSGREYLQRLKHEIQQSRIFLDNVPNLWPAADRMGRISKPFDEDSGSVYIETPPFTKVRASAKAIVAEVAFSEQEASYTVRLEHGFGFVTEYSGLGRVYVSESEEDDDFIEKGTILGTTMNNGMSDNCLKYRIKFASSYVDPDDFILSKY